MDQLNNLIKYWINEKYFNWLVISYLYLFCLTVISIPVFNCSINLLLSSVDRETNGAYNFVSFILIVARVGALIACLARLLVFVGTAPCVTNISQIIIFESC